jgi:glutaredoxin
VPRTVAITLLSKPGCHLCDDARDVIERVRSSLEKNGIETTLNELDILQDVTLARLHAEEIPVVLLDGRRHAIWRVDEDRLTAAIEKAARRPKLFSR